GLSVAILAVLLGTYLAYLSMRTHYPGHRLLALLGLMPLAMPSYILAACLRDVLSPSSFLGHTFNLSFFIGFFPALITLVVITTPYVQLLVSASLARLSASEIDAARTLGGTRSMIFRKIIFPHMRPSIAFAFLITLLYVVSEFGAVSVLNYPVLTWRLYQSVDHQQLAQATLLGTSLLALSIPMVLLARVIHGQVPLITQLANPKHTPRTPLSTLQKLFAYLMHALLLGLGLILPVIVLGTWVWQGLENHLTFAAITPALIDSLHIALMAGLFIVLLSVAPALYVARHPRGLGRIIEQATYLGSALPGVLLAFGLILIALFLARGLHYNSLYELLLQSGLLLMLGYALCFMAQSYASIKTAILRLDPRLYDTAKTLGASNWRYLLHIALPSLAPGIATGFILVFIAVLKELPVTLLLAGAMGLRPLSARVFDRYQEAFLHDTGLAGLVLLLLSLTMTAFILRWRSHV
ncbi:MAG TPA: ABC transporter permease subunit, partial [Gammaproteobacteria bacterium]|nr:ABC transporter permease subunit [Gammaproteobacteria bacterium]